MIEYYRFIRLLLLVTLANLCCNIKSMRNNCRLYFFLDKRLDCEDEDELLEGISRMVAGSVLFKEVGISLGESIGSVGTSWNGESGLLGDGCHEFREYHRGIQEGFHVASLVNI